MSAASLKANLTFDKIKSNIDKLTARGTFELAPDSDGANPATEAVTLMVGPFSQVLPPGAFTQKETAGKTTWTARGAVGGLTRFIMTRTGDVWTLNAAATGITLAGTTNPITLRLQIGNDSGAVVLFFLVTETPKKRIFKFPTRNKDDVDGDGFNGAGGDCNDANALIHPGAIELCNAIDDNCNGQVDEGVGETRTCGVGACERTVTFCAGGPPQECIPGPPSTEICGNGIDEDCTGADLECPDTTPPLYPGEKSSVGDGPISVAVADLNGDTRLDVVTANFVSNDISVLLSNGDGTFQAPLRFAVGTSPGSVTVTDLNGDTLLDAVTANFNSDDISILLGNGDGTFQAQQRFTAGDAPNSVALADFNGDTLLDVVTANFNSNDISVLLGNGNGTFQTQSRFVAGGNPASVAAADVNGDTRLDVVTANFKFRSDDISVFLGNGDGTFQAQRRFSVGSRGPYSVAIADLNGDTRLDVVTADNSFNDVSVLLGNGDGTFQTARLLNTGSGPHSIAVVDLNGDNLLDVVTANACDISVFLGNGDRTFQTMRRFAIGGGGAYSVAIADLDGDTRLDVVTANFHSDDISILFGNGDGTFPIQAGFTVGDAPPSVALADLNGDTRLDVVTANNRSGDLSVLSGNGDGTFQTEQRFGGTFARFVAIADLDGDTRLDVVTNGISVSLGNGDGTFQPERRFILTSCGSFSVAIGDLNGDTLLDVVTGCPNSNDITVLLGNGDGTFQARRDFDLGISFRPESVAIADLDGDMRLDIVTTTSGDSFFKGGNVLLGNGDGTFRVLPRFAVGGIPRSVVVADLNGDSRIDVVTADDSSPSDTISILLGNGDGTFQAPHSFNVSNIPYSPSPVVTDLNGDSLLDVVAANAFGFSVLLGKGDGTVHTERRFAVDRCGLFSVAVGDLNGDTLPDVVTANESSDDVSVLLHQ